MELKELKTIIGISEYYRNTLENALSSYDSWKCDGNIEKAVASYGFFWELYGIETIIGRIPHIPLLGEYISDISKEVHTYFNIENNNIKHSAELFKAISGVNKNVSESKQE